MSSNILNLRSYLATKVEEDNHKLNIYVVAKTNNNNCPHCQSSNLVGFGHREQVVKDLPIDGKSVAISIDTKRFQCKSCTKTFYESLPDIDEKRLMTNRLVAWIGKQATRRTFTSIANDVGIVEGTVRKIFRDYINELERTVHFDTPKWMGIDEVHLIKSSSIITNVEKNTIIELLADRNKETAINYLSTLNSKEQIQYVIMDMWQPHKEAVELVLPQANIVIDKSHVVKLANEGLDSFRKRFRESLTAKERRVLIHDKSILLKREFELVEKDKSRLSTWFKTYPDLESAYRIKEAFFNIYQAKSKDEALSLFNDWEKMIPQGAFSASGIHLVTPNISDCFSNLIRTWRSWQPYILNYLVVVNGKDTMDCHLMTNLHSESINNLVGVLGNIERGYSFEARRVTILFEEKALNNNYGVDVPKLISLIKKEDI